MLQRDRRNEVAGRGRRVASAWAGLRVADHAGPAQVHSAAWHTQPGRDHPQHFPADELPAMRLAAGLALAYPIALVIR